MLFRSIVFWGMVRYRKDDCVKVVRTEQRGGGFVACVASFCLFFGSLDRRRLSLHARPRLVGGRGKAKRYGAMYQRRDTTEHTHKDAPLPLDGGEIPSSFYDVR